MTIKEKLIDLLMQSGYEFLESCDYVTDMLKDLKSYAPGIYTFIVGNYTVKIKKG